MKKQVDVVMLPTEKANVEMIAKCIKDDFTNSFDRIGKLCLITNSKFYKPNIYWHSQHLYFLSDDEIKVGDYVYNKLSGIGKVISKGELGDDFVVIYNSQNFEVSEDIKNVKKIIATTDESLFIKEFTGIIDESNGVKEYCKHILPRPSNEFLKKYCELGGIDKVLVEYEVDTNNFPIPDNIETLIKEFPESFKLKLKVAPDNTITIYPI